jgi:hypothetical protein
MSILLYDPVGDIEAIEVVQENVFDTLQGKAVGYVFNQHVSSLVFWEQLERIVQTTFEPSRVVQVYKANTWSQAPKADIERIIRETDYALVGVGA